MTLQKDDIVNVSEMQNKLKETEVPVTVHADIRHKSAKMFPRFSAVIAKVRLMDLRCEFGVVACPRYSYIYMRYFKNKHSQNGHLELRDLKCFRICSPLHVRVFMVAVSRGRRGQGVYVPLKLVLRYLVVTRTKKQTAT